MLTDPALARTSALFNDMLDHMERAREQERAGSQRILDRGERDRRHVSRRLYDDVSQRLAALLTRLKTHVKETEASPVADPGGSSS